MASKIARLSETDRFIEIWQEEKRLRNILSDNYKIKQKKEKKCWKNVGKIRNDK